MGPCPQGHPHRNQVTGTRGFGDEPRRLERTGVACVGSDTGCNVPASIWDAFAENSVTVQVEGPAGHCGSPQRRGVVVSATYEAARQVIHSAMPMGRAFRVRKPRLSSIPSRGSTTVRVAAMSILNDVSAQVEVSIDEAFLDVSGARRTLDHPGRCGCDRSRMQSSPAAFRWVR